MCVKYVLHFTQPVTKTLCRNLHLAQLSFTYVDAARIESIAANQYPPTDNLFLYYCISDSTLIPQTVQVCPPKNKSVYVLHIDDGWRHF